MGLEIREIFLDENEFNEFISNKNINNKKICIGVGGVPYDLSQIIEIDPVVGLEIGNADFYTFQKYRFLHVNSRVYNLTIILKA